MISFLKYYTIYSLVFLLERFLEFENWWYEAIWSRWLPSNTTILDKLVLKKEDEIWRAVIFGKDGDVRMILEAVTNQPEQRAGFSYNTSSSGGIAFSSRNPAADSSSGRIEAGALFNGVKAKIQKAVETDTSENEPFGTGLRFEMAVHARLGGIADRLANSSRNLTKKEREKAQEWSMGTVSILWMAIHRGHKSDVRYLLRERNPNLHIQNGLWEETVLHQAVSKADCDLVREILEATSSTSPDMYINLGDFLSRTALHYLAFDSMYSDNFLSLTNADGVGKTIEMLHLLLDNGANVNALDEDLMTPLHQLLSAAAERGRAEPTPNALIPLLQNLLASGAEVNIKDIKGNSPLHIACILQNREAIETLVHNGADPQTPNRDGKTPRGLFLGSGAQDEDFWRRMTILSRGKIKMEVDLSTPSRVSPHTDHRNAKEKGICNRTLVYCRYQKANPGIKSSNPLHWTAVDKYVSDVLYPADRSKGTTFLAECDKQCQYAWQDLLESCREVDREDESEHEQKSTAEKAEEVKSSTTLAKDVWRWVNFPANNVTWMRQFIAENCDNDATTCAFLAGSMKVRGGRNNSPPIVQPHASMMSKCASESSKNYHGDTAQNRSVISLAIPFIDIEVGPENPSTATQYEGAYSPFTGLSGMQLAQTLDQSSFNAKSLSKLGSKENQVIYRWSLKKGFAEQKQLPLELRVQDRLSNLASLLRRIGRRAEGYENRGAEDSPLGRARRDGVRETARNLARMHRLRKERHPKWLMVRQLWLWKLDDGTILTAIPSRRNKCTAADLLETIRESNLHNVSSGDDLMKHIVQQTITFPGKFLRAGLGEHILDVFEGEIATEADEEAALYNSFIQNDCDSKHANRAIGCTWRVKDIRDELGFIKEVFWSQTTVVQQFAKILAQQQAKTSGDMDCIGALVLELDRMIGRIRSMDNDAATTLESDIVIFTNPSCDFDQLNHITQTMLGQSSLKEAESASVMNFIILPFTIVTVIFTPLSFMTSLFAVNSDGFPHNEEAELRIPSDWFWRKMVIGEFGTIIPLFLFVLFLYYLRSDRRNRRNEQPVG